MAKKINIKSVVGNGKRVISGRITDTDRPEASVYSNYSVQTATAGQTVFSCSFTINKVFKNNVVLDPDDGSFTGWGTPTITFTAGLNLGDRIYLST